MTAPTIAATPQLQTAAAIKALLDADFKDRGYACAVEIGEWAPEIDRGLPRVMINIADGTIGEPSGHWNPGLQVRVNETSGATGPVTATLAGGSTITHAISGTPIAPGAFVIRIDTGGMTGIGSDIEWSLSVDGGATFEASTPLDADTTIVVYGLTVDLGSGTVATAGDTIAWRQAAASYQLARPILDRTAGFLLRIHAPAPSSVSTTNIASEAQRATVNLVAVTAIAIRRALGSNLREKMREHWPTSIPRYSAFFHGSLCELSFVWGVPLLDDALGVGRALEATMTAEIAYPNGTTSPVSSVTVPIP